MLVNGRYRVLGPLGGGGQGRVFRAEDLERGGAEVALKALAGGAPSDLLRWEFEQLRALSHPNLARVRDLDVVRRLDGAEGGLSVGAAFLTEDLVRGLPVDRAAPASAEGRVETSWIVAVAAAACRALQYLHERGVVHRDVKPANLLVTDDPGDAVLIDLGLSTKPGRARGGVSGSLATMAPEALGGIVEPRSDLWSLGVTLFRVVTGRFPFGAGAADAGAVVRDILAGRRPELRAHARDLDPALAELIEGLLSQDPRDRPRSASAVLDDLGRRFGPEAIGLKGEVDSELAVAAGASRWTPRALGRRHGALVGRAAEVELLSLLLSERFDPSRATSAVVVVAGPAGVGKSALVREVIDRSKLGMLGLRAPPLAIRGGLRAVASMLRREAAPTLSTPRLDGWLGEPSGAGRAAGLPDAAALNEELCSLLVHVASRHPLLVHLERGDDEATRALWMALHRRGAVGALADEAPTALALVVEVRRESGEAVELPAGAPVVEVRPLPDDELRAVVTERVGPVPDGALGELTRLARGRPALAIGLLSKALDLGPLDRLSGDMLRELASAGEALDVIGAAVAALGDDVRRALLALSIWDRPAAAADLAALIDEDVSSAAAAMVELRRAGWLELDERGLARPPGAELRRGLGASEEEAAIAARALDLVAATAPEDSLSRARLALLAGHADAPAFALEAGLSLLASGDPLAAIDMLEPAAAGGDEAVAGAAREALRRATLAAGRYADAVELWRRAVEAGEPGAKLELARTLRLNGDADAARAAAEELLDDEPLGARALLARLALDHGDAREALARLGDVSPGEAAGDAAAELEEVAGLAHLALGDVDVAEAHFEVCLALAEDGDDPVAVARAHNLVGMVAHRRERWSEVAEHASEAARLAAAAGHVHAAATYGVNVAVALVESGELASALDALRRSVSTLASLGRAGELAGALYNLASLLLSLGDVEAARRVVGRARETARESGARQVAAYCELLEAEVLAREAASDEARIDEALAAADWAIEAFEGIGGAHEVGYAKLLRGELLGRAGRAAESAAVLDEVREAAAARSEPDTAARAALTIGRLAVEGLWDLEDAERVGAGAREAMTGGSSELAWRLAVTAARIAEARGDVEAAGRLAREAAAVVDELRRAVPRSYRDRWDADPDRRALTSLRDRLEATAPVGVTPAAAGARGAPRTARLDVLHRLLDINKRLNSELRLGRLLDEIIDTIVQLTDAERGFLLLRERDGSLRARSARNVDRSSLASEELRLSRSIAEQVVESGEPVLTVDARADDRFDTAASVHALRLRSILAVPLRVKGEIVGAVYVDDRLRPNAFGEDALALALDVADQAAIAIENARLLAENKRRQRKIEGLARRLQREIDRQKVELDELRRELDGQRSELATKYSYDAIVARSSAMTKVFRVLDRVTDSEVPVVIQGESGTGKELVARAIHFNGPRRDRPFVTENCGAIPETLLESVLFGHVRGAFTGADRSRQGLFEIASGGTLLLDEISEMTPAMQAKLLRVLQEGELRPVGGDRTVAVDVRVITSSNQDLAELVRRGKFREDLFYRLNVITVRLPPLRDRAEDVPLLVEHFIRKHGGGRVAGVDRTALRCLTGYSWPGNVRQLENEVMRATVLADEIIREEHLSPEIVEGRRTSPRPDDLDLRAHVAHLEKALIAKALERFNGNQSRAAKALGLSRYGLQKKLTRYGMRPRR